jgi:hypothetical protein
MVKKSIFFGRMSRDGRITIPKLTVDLLQEKMEGKSLVGHVLKVQLSPFRAAIARFFSCAVSFLFLV